MKSLKVTLGLVLFLLSLVACEKSEKTDYQSEIYGIWKLTEVLSDIGDGNGQWREIENGYEYIFYPGGTFTSTRFTDCTVGIYTVNADELTLDFDCENITIGNTEIPNGILIENISFESDF